MCRGGTKSAVEALAKAHSLFEIAGEAQRAADMLYGIGEVQVHHLEDMGAAKDALEAALSQYHKLGKLLEQGSTLRLLGGVAAKGRDWEAAEAFLRRSEEVFMKAEAHEQAAATREGIRRLYRQRNQLAATVPEEDKGSLGTSQLANAEIQATTCDETTKAKAGTTERAMHPRITLQQDRPQEQRRAKPAPEPTVAGSDTLRAADQKEKGNDASIKEASINSAIGAMEAEMRAMRDELAELRDFRDQAMRGGTSSEVDTRIGIGLAVLVAVLAALLYALARKLA